MNLAEAIDRLSFCIAPEGARMIKYESPDGVAEIQLMSDPALCYAQEYRQMLAERLMTSAPDEDLTAQEWNTIEAVIHIHYGEMYGLLCSAPQLRVGLTDEEVQQGLRELNEHHQLRLKTLAKLRQR